MEIKFRVATFGSPNAESKSRVAESKTNFFNALW